MSCQEIVAPALAYSRMLFAYFTLDQRMDSFLHCHRLAFRVVRRHVAADSLRQSEERRDAALGPGFRNQDEVARTLHVSGSTLKRRLAEFDTTFAEQLGAAQRSRALSLLEAAELSVGDTALEAGFSDAGSFVRAFRKWFGETPGRYRQVRQQRAAIESPFADGPP